MHQPNPKTRDQTPGGCPLTGGLFTGSKTNPGAPSGPPLHKDASGTWHVRGFVEARAILRADQSEQAGFRAEEINRTPLVNKPVLYMEGEAHHEQRRATARFFTPRATQGYAALMTDYARQLLEPLAAGGKADLSDLSMKMAVQVAARVIGLTNSHISGMERRLGSFFDQPEEGGRLRHAWSELLNQWRLLLFYLLDVRPAIRARKKEPQADVISHLIESGYNDPEIVTVCIMYGAAGMVTTREFICVAAWHLLETGERVGWYRRASEEERFAFLYELLRLEPVVGHLQRRTTGDLEVESQGNLVTIPAGSLVDLHLYEINADARAVGDAPHHLCPGREMSLPRVWPEVMGFGDGHHRCAGAYLATRETDIFLSELLSLEGVRIRRGPEVGWNPIAKGYELRNFMLEVPR